jgi:hypothetical protein
MEEQETFFLEGTPEEICREVVADRGEFDRSIAELSRQGAATIEKCQGLVKIVSRRLLKKINLTEYNRLKQREHRQKSTSNESQDPPSKDIEIKSLRALDSPIGEVRDKPTPEKREPKILLPSDFSPTDEMRTWASIECPNVAIDQELEEFVTFWCDIATKNNRRTVRGWVATWKNRMRELQKKNAVLAYSANGNAAKSQVGKYDPSKPYIPDPPCAVCGQDVCFDLHREAA